MRGTWGAGMMSGDRIVRADDELLAGFEAHATAEATEHSSSPIQSAVGAACHLRKQLTRIGQNRIMSVQGKATNRYVRASTKGRASGHGEPERYCQAVS